VKHRLVARRRERVGWAGAGPAGGVVEHEPPCCSRAPGIRRLGGAAPPHRYPDPCRTPSTWCRGRVGESHPRGALEAPPRRPEGLGRSPCGAPDAFDGCLHWPGLAAGRDGAGEHREEEASIHE
jgi:hypothetical protein